MSDREQIERKLENSFAAKYLSDQEDCRGGWKDFSKKGESALSELPYLRRLDSFAILFEYLVNCAGVTLVGGQLVFAANKLTFANEDFNRRIWEDIISRTMHYFQELAQQAVTRSTRDLRSMREDAFRRLCSHQRILSIKKPSIKGGEELKINIKDRDVSEAVIYILQGNKLSIEDVLHRYGSGVDKIIVYQTAQLLYKHFERVENFIKETASKVGRCPSEAGLLNAILNCHLIILPEPKENVHVELQLVGYALGFSEQSMVKNIFFYLGISKLYAKDILSASSLFSIVTNTRVVFAYIDFVEFMFNDDALEVYYSQHVVNEVDSEKEMLALQLLPMLEQCKRNKDLLDKLTLAGLYNPGTGAFARFFITSVLQDEAFVGMEIAEHFRSNSEIFNMLGSMVETTLTQAQQCGAASMPGTYLPAAYAAASSSAQVVASGTGSATVDQSRPKAPF